MTERTNTSLTEVEHFPKESTGTIMIHSPHVGSCRSRPDTTPSLADELPNPYSLPIRAVMVACYFTAVAIALAGTIISIRQLFIWGDVWLTGIEGWWAVFKCALAVFSIVYCGRWLLMLALIAAEYQRRNGKQPIVRHWPKISICLPAFNEASSIAQTIESLLRLDYPDFEVIVVDDGSQDETYNIASRYVGRYSWGSIRVYRKANGGKWTALNYAFHRSTGEIFVSIDADGALDRDSLKRGAARMADPEVDALAGYTRVKNRTNVLTYLQALEFVFWNGAIRLPQSQSGTVICVPGPLGFFRRSTLEEVYLRFGKLSGPSKPGTEGGPYEGTTFAEDFDLTVAILMMGGKVEYEPLAACDTDAPDSMFALLNQRYRWSRGSLQALRKYFARIRAESSYRRFRLFGWLFLSYVYDLATFVFAMAVNLVVLTMALAGSDSENGMVFIAYTVVQLGFKLITAILFLLIHRESLRLLWMIPLLEFYGSFVLGSALIISAIDEVRSESMRW